MSAQTDKDLNEVIDSCELALKALAPILNKYKRLTNRHHAVGSHLLATKSNLQNTIQEAQRVKIALANKSVPAVKNIIPLDKSKKTPIFKGLPIIADGQTVP